MPKPGFLLRGAMGRRGTPMIVAIILSVLALFLSGLIGTILFAPLLAEQEEIARAVAAGGAVPGTDPSILIDIMLALIGYTAGVFALVWLWLRYWERRAFITLGLEGGGLTRLTRGGLFGIGASGLMAMALVASGAATPAIAPGEWPLAIALAALVMLPLGWLCQAASEEVLFRGFLLQAVGRHHGIALAAGLSSLVFTLMHLGGGIANGWYVAGIAVLGLFFCLYAIAENSLFGVIGFHTAWNAAQNGLFGITPVGDDVTVNTLFLLLQRGPRVMALETSAGTIGIITLALGLAMLAIAFWAVLRNTRAG